jgi:hypothetical protein
MSDKQQPHSPRMNSAEATLIERRAPLALERAFRVLKGDIRCEDFLEVPEDILSFVEGGEMRTGVRMQPASRRQMIVDLALQHHHAGDIVLCYRTDDGVIVLAAGPEAVASVSKSLPIDMQGRVSIEYPPDRFE